MRFAIPLAFFLMLEQSCDFGGDEKKATKEQAKPEPPRPGLHRFVLTKDASVAFDTQTGQICKTWGWEPTGKPLDADPVSGNRPQRQFGEFAPTCLSLYQMYPSGVGVELPSQTTTPEQ